ncbi:MAG: 5'/3'-nucleotidase SurE [Planctomycetes bacterium]|nr:5'/3'-nucleotidase SurE [Planctomycetota bacterium]
MRILITNDDGMNAEGLVVLESAAQRLGGEIYVVAPEIEHSAQSHAITVRQPLFAREVPKTHGEALRVAVSGTPCDCVRLGLIKLLDFKPDLCLSGINHGGNMGWDVFFSGTVSAAAEAHSFGVPAIALSLASWAKADWRGLDVMVAELMRTLISAKHSRKDYFYNVNIPPVAIGKIKGALMTRQEPTVKGDNFEQRKAPDGRIYYWPTWDERKAAREKLEGLEYDSAAVKAGYISVTPLLYEVSNLKEPGAAVALKEFKPNVD